MNSSHGQCSIEESISLVNCWPCYVFLHLPKHEVIGVRDCCHTCLSYEIICFLLDLDFFMISPCCHNLSQAVSSQRIKHRYLIHLDPGQVIFFRFFRPSQPLFSMPQAAAAPHAALPESQRSDSVDPLAAPVDTDSQMKVSQASQDAWMMRGGMNERFLIGLIDVDCLKYDRLSCRFIININQQCWIFQGFIWERIFELINEIEHEPFILGAGWSDPHLFLATLGFAHKGALFAIIECQILDGKRIS